jgi:hypothetical protein
VRHSGKAEPPSGEAATTAARLAQAEELERTRRAARDETADRFAAVHRLLIACRDVIRSTDPTALAPIVLTPRTAKTSRETDLDLARVRADIATVATERAALAGAPVPLAEAAARLDGYLDALARQWEPPLGTDFTPPTYQPPSPDDYWPFKPMVLLAGHTIPRRGDASSAVVVRRC